ncbi:MAG: hypothetical protein AB2559_20510 [Candidatus Thiodiazotropha endolucinida]
MELHSSDIERQITKLQQAITDAEAEHRELAFQYSETGEKGLMDQMMRIRETVSVFRYEVEASEVAKDQALKREAEEADEAATREILDRVAQGKELMDQRVAMARKLEKQFAALGKAMEEFLAISEQIREHHQALFEKGGPGVFWGTRNFTDIPQIHGWKTALRTAGLSEFLKPNFHLPPGKQTGGAAMTLVEAIQMQHERVRYRTKVMHIINNAREETSNA